MDVNARNGVEAQHCGIGLSRLGWPCAVRCYGAPAAVGGTAFSGCRRLGLRGRTDPAKPFFYDHGSFWTNSAQALLASGAAAECQGSTRNRCLRDGYESMALIPLRAGTQVFGLLQFNDHRQNRFTPALIAYFEELADSLAMTLSRRQADEALRASECRHAKTVTNIGIRPLPVARSS